MTKGSHCLGVQSQLVTKFTTNGSHREPLQSQPTDNASHLPHKVKTQYQHFRFHGKYFLLPQNIPEETSRQSILFITKDSIMHIKHMYIHPFTTVVN